MSQLAPGPSVEHQRVTRREQSAFDGTDTCEHPEECSSGGFCLGFTAISKTHMDAERKDKGD